MLELIEKLAGDSYSEESLNAASIISELLEVKSFFVVVAKAQPLKRLKEIAFNRDNLKCRNDALTVLTKFVQWYNDRQK